MEGLSPVLLGTFAMLGSAIAHSGIALFTKQSGDTLVFRIVLMCVGSLLFLPALVYYPFPTWEVWRFLLLGAVIHWTFQMAMIAAFDRGDMGLVYPVMRGSAPALAALAAIFLLNEYLNWIETVGLVIASLAVIGFGWPQKGGAPKAKALAFALLAASMTALYSVNDASGARAAVSPLQYLAWFYPMVALPLLLTGILRRGARLPGLMRQELRSGAIAAVFGSASYFLALLAFTLAPVGPMAAMRETSIVFGALLATLVLKEPFGRRRIFLAILLAAGLVLVQVF